MVITRFRGSPKENPWILAIFSVRTSRTRHVPDSSTHSLYLIKLFNSSSPKGNFRECATSTHTHPHAQPQHTAAHSNTPHQHMQYHTETEKEREGKKEKRQDNTSQDKRRQVPVILRETLAQMVRLVSPLLLPTSLLLSSLYHTTTTTTSTTTTHRETERQRDRETEREDKKKPKYNERFARPSIMVSCFFATFLIYEYIDKKIVFICYHESSRTPQHSEWNCVGANRPQHMHMYGHCLWLNFEHIKNSNRSKKLIFATKKIEIESAKYFKNPPKWFEFISARMVLGLWDLSLLTVFYVVWVCSCGASFITATVSFKIDSGTRTPTICSTIRSETCSWHMSFVCELPSLLV